MRQAIQDLDLEALWIVYPGSRSFQPDEKIYANPLSHLLGESANQ
jgi:hydroxymethylpyrimidine pyrophosphatase-like HAD family hydrolase